MSFLRQYLPLPWSMALFLSFSTAVYAEPPLGCMPRREQGVLHQERVLLLDQRWW